MPDVARRFVGDTHWFCVVTFESHPALMLEYTETFFTFTERTIGVLLGESAVADLRHEMRERQALSRGRPDCRIEVAHRVFTVRCSRFRNSFPSSDAAQVSSSAVRFA